MAVRVDENFRLGRAIETAERKRKERLGCARCVAAT